MNGHQSNISVFMLGAILNTLAVVDMNGLVDYSVKAILGGVIWLSFKILADYIGTKMNAKIPKEKSDTELFTNE